MVFTSHDRPGQQDLNCLDLQLEGFSAAPKASTRHSGELLSGRIYTQRRGAKEREKQGSLAVPRLYRLECYRDAMERRAERGRISPRPSTRAALVLLPPVWPSA